LKHLIRPAYQGLSGSLALAAFLLAYLAALALVIAPQEITSALATTVQ
jgi:hypothetical protein